MAASDLTTTSAVKAWLGDVSTANDAAYSALATAVSRAIYSKLQRPQILPANYTEVFDGRGASRLVLKNWPVISVSSVTADTAPIVASPNALSYGWALEMVDPTPPSRPQSLYMRQDVFSRGVQNIAVTYAAGYQVVETQTVTAAAATASAPYGAWASNAGVTYAATGVALSLVASAPAQGQYTVNAGAYGFNAADNGAAVVLTYGFVPADLAQAATEWAAGRFKSQSYIGMRSKSLGGQETVSYDTGAMPAFVDAAIQPFKRVTMC